MPKRPIYSELMARKAAVEERLACKKMLRDGDAVRAELHEVDAQFIKDTRQKLGCSRALFARRLCMNEPSKNGSRGGQSRTLRPLFCCCWFESFPTLWNGYEELRIRTKSAGEIDARGGMLLIRSCLPGR